MTAYALHLGRERAVIACDTASYLPGTPPRLVGYDMKVRPLAHLRAAAFGLGSAGIITEAINMIALAPQLDTAERVAEAMPEFLRRATARYCSDTGISDPAGYGLVELFLVGWSEAERRMRIWLWSNLQDFATHTDFVPIDETISVPPLAEMPARTGSLDEHLAVVMKAERLFFETTPAYGGMIGGEVHAWTISRDGLSQRVIYRFPDERPDIDFLARLSEEPIDMMAHLFTAREIRAAALRTWTGGLGNYALQLADASLRKSGLLPDPPRPDDTLADMPVIKAFVVRYPASSQSVQDFYDLANRNKAFFDTWLARAREGDGDAMQRIQEAGGPGMFLQIDNIRKSLAQQSQFIRDVWKNSTMPSDNKRELIDQTYFGMMQIAATGANLLRQQAMPAPEPPPPAVPAPAPVIETEAVRKRRQLEVGGFSEQEINRLPRQSGGTAARGATVATRP